MSSESQELTLGKAPDGELEGPSGSGVVYVVDGHAAELPAETHTLTKRETLSAYFTIAAAAFGLISDGCKILT